jgi:hypothetical protein
MIYGLVWGDDGVTILDASDFPSQLERLVRRANAIGQELEAEKCKRGPNPTYLKVVILGLQAVRRVMSLHKEKKGTHATPFTVAADFKDAYDMCVRSGDDAGARYFLSFMVQTNNVLRGYGHEVVLRDGWFMFGGEMFPKISGVLPLSSSRVAMRHYCGYFQPISAAMNQPLGRELRVPALSVTDRKALRLSDSLLGLYVDSEGREVDETGVASGVTIKYRGLQNINERYDEVTGSMGAKMARNNFRIPLKGEVISRSDAALRSLMGKVKNIDVLERISYGNKVAKQGSGVMQEMISYEGSDKALAERVNDVLDETEWESLPLGNRVVGRYRVQPEANLATFGHARLTYSTVGHVQHDVIDERKGVCEVRIVIRGAIDTSFESNCLFEHNKGRLERIAIDVFGIDSALDPKTEELVPGRPDVTARELLNCLKTVGGNLVLLEVIMGVDPGSLALRFGADQRDRLEALLELIDDGSYRNGDGLSSIGHKMGQYLLHIGGSGIFGMDAGVDEDSVTYKALMEHLICYNVTIWNMMLFVNPELNIFPLFGIHC